MAGGAVDALFPHLSLKVLLNYAWRHLLVTLDARAFFRGCRCHAAREKDKTYYQ
jgi:hypothetical protein